MNAEDSHPLYAVRFSDGTVSLYVDEAYALERGVDPAQLRKIDIPKKLYVSGTVQEIREYVATLLETETSGSA
jgi:hypothetical protein